MSAALQPHVVQNLAALAVLCAMVFAVVRFRRSPFWAPRLRAAFRRRGPRTGLAVVALYALVAWLDAVSWADRAPASDAPLEARQPRSLLDRAFSLAAGTPEYAFRERSYSAPFARVEFGDRTIPLKHLHPLGTTQTGYDTLHKVLKGTKPAMVIGTLPLLIAVPLALLLGIAAGWWGGRVDDAVVYVYSTIASVPHLLLLMAIVTALGRGLPQIAAGLGVLGWVGLCRLVRAETMKLREMEYVQAAVALGVRPFTILRRHVVPNLMHLVLISTVLAFTGLVLTETILSYLGIGLDNSWGAMVNHARNELSREPVIWWNITFASFAVFCLVLSVNVVGDALREALDPRSREAV
jgi:peptide/nickel transport system permease protein